MGRACSDSSKLDASPLTIYRDARYEHINVWDFFFLFSLILAMQLFLYSSIFSHRISLNFHKK